MRLSLSIVLLLLAIPSFAAEDRLVNLDTRPGVSVSFYYMKRDGAEATVVLLTGEGAVGLG
jgi:hypothetical protein